MAYYIEKPFTHNGGSVQIYYQQVSRNDGNGIIDTIWTNEYDDKTTLSTFSAANSIASTFKNAQVRTV